MPKPYRNFIAAGLLLLSTALQASETKPLGPDELSAPDYDRKLEKSQKLLDQSQHQLGEERVRGEEEKMRRIAAEKRIHELESRVKKQAAAPISRPAKPITPLVVVKPKKNLPYRRPLTTRSETRVPLESGAKAPIADRY